MDGERETRNARIWLGGDGVIRTILASASELTVQDVKDQVVTYRELIGDGRRAPNLVDYRGVRSIDRDARRYYAGEETAACVSAAALVVDSPLSRALANFFMGLNRPLIPTRLFTSEDEALRWLEGFVT